VTLRDKSADDQYQYLRVPAGEIPIDFGIRNIFGYLLFGSDNVLTTQSTQNLNMAVTRDSNLAPAKMSKNR